MTNTKRERKFITGSNHIYIGGSAKQHNNELDRLLERLLAEHTTKQGGGDIDEEPLIVKTDNSDSDSDSDSDEEPLIIKTDNSDEELKEEENIIGVDLIIEASLEQHDEQHDEQHGEQHDEQHDEQHGDNDPLIVVPGGDEKGNNVKLECVIRTIDDYFKSIKEKTEEL